MSLRLPLYTPNPEIQNLMLSKPVLNLYGIWCVAAVVLALSQLPQYIANLIYQRDVMVSGPVKAIPTVSEATVWSLEDQQWQQVCLRVSLPYN